jgi:hypothetical protein
VSRNIALPLVIDRFSTALLAAKAEGNVMSIEQFHDELPVNRCHVLCGNGAAVFSTMIASLLSGTKPVWAEETKVMPAQIPEQCDELFGKYVNSRDLDNLVALYEAQASLVNEDGTAARGTAAICETM